jgi:hypothetical protein
VLILLPRSWHRNAIARVGVGSTRYCPCAAACAVSLAARFSLLTYVPTFARGLSRRQHPAYALFTSTPFFYTSLRLGGPVRPSLLFSTAALVSTLGLGCTDGPAPTDPSAPAATEPASLTRAAAPTPLAPTTQLLVTGLQELQGSTVGPGGALFVTAPLTGRIWRVDPETGAVTLFASGLPARIPDFFFIGSGVVDLAFIDGTAYALVTGVGPDLEGDDVVGIYRVDGPNSFTVVADLGAFSVANPPATDFFVPTGFQYAIESFRGGFLVTDGHHNRVLWVTRDGEITELIAFGNVVPTGLTVSGNLIYVAQAGPIPHKPEDGRVVVFGARSSAETVVAAGAPLLVDVEFGRGRTLFALAQGVWDGPFEGTPALPNTGALVRVDGSGTFTVLAEGLDRPTSLEIINNTAYVVTLGGEIWTIDSIAGPPFGRPLKSR